MEMQFGKYEVIQRLGTGGMGIVYLAKDTILGRQVALKVLDQQHHGDEDIVKRFLHEARIAASLTHPNIVVIYDFGTDGKVSFIAMEYLVGENLRSIITKRSPLSIAKKLVIALQVAKALEHAHAASVIHRDVKPSNIQVLPSDDVKLMDFGIAKLASAEMTRSGIAIGTPHYSSPEQVRSLTVTPASDVFSFGLVLYELLTYRKAFQGEDFAALVYNIAYADPAPYEAQDNLIPPALKSLISRCLAKSPEDRYETFTPIMDTLRGVLRDLSSLRSRAKSPLPTEIFWSEEEECTVKAMLAGFGEPAEEATLGLPNQALEMELVAAKIIPEKPTRLPPPPPRREPPPPPASARATRPKSEAGKAVPPPRSSTEDSGSSLLQHRTVPPPRSSSEDSGSSLLQHRTVPPPRSSTEDSGSSLLPPKIKTAEETAPPRPQPPEDPNDKTTVPGALPLVLPPLQPPPPQPPQPPPPQPPQPEEPGDEYSATVVPIKLKAAEPPAVEDPGDQSSATMVPIRLADLEPRIALDPVAADPNDESIATVVPIVLPPEPEPAPEDPGDQSSATLVPIPLPPIPEQRPEDPGDESGATQVPIPLPPPEDPGDQSDATEVPVQIQPPEDPGDQSDATEVPVVLQPTEDPADESGVAEIPNLKRRSRRSGALLVGALSTVVAAGILLTIWFWPTDPPPAVFDLDPVQTVEDEIAELQTTLIPATPQEGEPELPIVVLPSNGEEPAKTETVTPGGSLATASTPLREPTRSATDPALTELQTEADPLDEKATPETVAVLQTPALSAQARTPQASPSSSRTKATPTSIPSAGSTPGATPALPAATAPGAASPVSDGKTPVASVTAAQTPLLAGSRTPSLETPSPLASPLVALRPEDAGQLASSLAEGVAGLVQNLPAIPIGSDPEDQQPEDQQPEDQQPEVQQPQDPQQIAEPRSTPPVLAPTPDANQVKQQRRAVREALRQYIVALEHRDASGIRKLWPTISTKDFDRLVQDFAGMESQKVEIRVGQFSFPPRQPDAPERIRIQCRLKRSIRPKGGGDLRVDEGEVVIELRKEGRSWLIDSVI